MTRCVSLGSSIVVEVAEVVCVVVIVVAALFGVVEYSYVRCCFRHSKE